MGQIQIEPKTEQAQTFESYGIFGINYNGAEKQYLQCPQCTPGRKKENQKDKDLTVWVHEGTWHCNHCGWGKGEHLKKGTSAGSSSTISSQGASRQPATIHPLLPNTGIKIFRPAADYRVPQMQELDEPALEYLLGRGISEKTARALGIKIWEKKLLGGFESYFCIPLYVGDTLVNWKLRRFPEKGHLQTQGADKVWMNLNSIREHNYCIITEGELDLAAFLEIGQIPVLSVPEGAPEHDAQEIEQKMSFVGDCLHFFDHIERIYLAVDNDRNGQRLQNELIERLGRSRCWIVKFPSGCKDANDVLMRLGKEALERCFDTAEPVPVSGVVRVKDFRNLVESLYRDGMPPAARTRFEGVDKIFKVYPGVGTLNVITGIPSHGKTVFLDNYLLSLAEGNGLRIGMYSREHRPDYHVARLAEIFAGKRFMPNYATQMQRHEMEEAVAFVEDHVFHLYDFKDERYFSIGEIMDTALYLQKAEGIDVLVLDPWNKIKHDVLPKETDRQYIARTLRDLHAFAKRTGLNIWIVAHTRKMGKASDGLNYEMPNAYSIADANEWFAMPDNILLLYRYFFVQGKALTGESKTFFKTLKIKDDFYGEAERFVHLELDKNCHRFYEPNALQNRLDFSGKDSGKDRALPAQERERDADDEVPF